MSGQDECGASTKAIRSASFAAMGTGASHPPTPPTAWRGSGADPYAWLENPSDQETLAYLEVENRHAEAVMAATGELRATLYAEMLGRIEQTDQSVPIPVDGWFYYTRTEEGRQYPISCRKRGRLDAPEEILLDLNALVEEYIALRVFRPSPDHRYLAHSLNEDGGLEYTLYLKDLDTGRLLPEQVPNVEQAEWAADGRTIFYTRQDAAKRPFELLRHTLGDDPASDALLYREEDQTFSLYLTKSDSRAYLFLLGWNPETTEVRFLPVDRPTAPLALFAPRRRGIQYFLEHHGDDFLIRTNERAVNFKLMAAPVANPVPDAWREVVPHRESALLDGVHVFAQHLVLSGAEEGLDRIWVHDLAVGRTRSLSFDEAVYAVGPVDNWEFATTRLRFEFTSLVTPVSTYDEDLATGERTLLKREAVLGGHDSNDYVSERLFAEAVDGERVPISVVRRRDAAGPGPLLLMGYGAYGSSFPPSFDANRLSLLERGVGFAVAHVRGGQELGRRWYDDGKLLQKKNTFTDFVACAEHLIAAGYAAPDRLVAQGGSAGGLLMGAITNMRPDLFAAVVAEVPFVDVVRTMLDPSLPLTAGEFDEWGDPRDPVYRDYIGSYSPYDNVVAQPYPALLITAGLNDDQVRYWEAAKWTAKLRASKTDANPLLLKTEMGAGHGGPSGRYDALREIAFLNAFVLLALERPANPVGRGEAG